MYGTHLLPSLCALRVVIALPSSIVSGPTSADLDFLDDIFPSAGPSTQSEDVHSLWTTWRAGITETVNDLDPRNAFHLADGGLELRSALGSIDSVNGEKLYSASIETAGYLDVLTKARETVNSDYGNTETTEFYRFNHTRWSFIVAVPNSTIHYASIAAVLSRYTKLVPAGDPQMNITRTRVGRIDKYGVPLANVALLPSDLGPTAERLPPPPPPPPPPAPVDGSPREVNVTTITPFGSSWSMQALTGHELDIFDPSLSAGLHKRQGGLEFCDP